MGDSLTVDSEQMATRMPIPQFYGIRNAFSFGFGGSALLALPAAGR
jgi:hypothetical protein